MAANGKVTNPRGRKELLAHLRRIGVQPGEVRNPKGRNQYTYRRDAERAFDRLLREVVKREEDGGLPRDVCRSEILLQRIIDWAENGEDSVARFAMDQILQRILPAPKRLEGSIDVPQPDTTIDDLLASPDLSDHELEVLEGILQKTALREAAAGEA